jgi:hypothetical protein
MDSSSVLWYNHDLFKAIRSYKAFYSYTWSIGRENEVDSRRLAVRISDGRCRAQRRGRGMNESILAILPWKMAPSMWLAQLCFRKEKDGPPSRAAEGHGRNRLGEVNYN